MTLFLFTDANNPSDLFKLLQKNRTKGKEFNKSNTEEALSTRPAKHSSTVDEKEEEHWEEMTYDRLAETMKEEHGLALKNRVFQNMRAEERIMVSLCVK